MAEQHEVSERKIFSPGEQCSSRELRDKPLVVDARITKLDTDNCTMRRILTYTGALKGVLHYNCFKEMGLNDTFLSPYAGKLEGFTNHKMTVKGIITIQVILKDGVISRFENVFFLMIDLVSNYNTIFEVPTIGAFEIIASLPC